MRILHGTQVAPNVSSSPSSLRLLAHGAERFEHAVSDLPEPHDGESPKEEVAGLEESCDEEGGVRHSSPLAVELRGGEVVRVPWKLDRAKKQKVEPASQKRRKNQGRKVRRDFRDANWKATERSQG